MEPGMEPTKIRDLARESANNARHQLESIETEFEQFAGGGYMDTAYIWDKIRLIEDACSRLESLARYAKQEDE